MSKYWDNKKVHKNVRTLSKIRNCYDVRPICKVDNKTSAYKASTNWNEVTCLRCLGYKKKIDAILDKIKVKLP